MSESCNKNHWAIESTERRRAPHGLRVFARVILATVALLVLLAYWPISWPPLTYTPHRHLSFSEALSYARVTIEAAPSTLQPECQGQVLHHGYRTKRVFVLMHGLSNCPAQFRALGELLHQRGHTVVLPRLPEHGEKDRLTEEWKNLTAQQMLDSANQTIDLSLSLGERVTVVGLSTNGAIAAWIAQNRGDVDQVVLLAPFFAPKGLPEWALAPLTRLALRLPNRFLWWDAEQKDAGGNGYSYPRFPTRTVAQVLQASVQLLETSQTAAPEAGSIVVVTTAADQTADPSTTRTLVAQWRKHRPDAIRTYEFALEQQVDHDFIDPTSPSQRVDLVYPKLLSLLEQSNPPSK